MKPQDIFLFALCGLALLWSWVNNPDTFIWALEASPGVLACVILLSTYKKFRFTTLAYFFVLLHCIVLFIGAKYTYGEVPLFNWLRDTYALERNNYDKVGHFAQGFFPALLVRELIIRLNLVNGRNWIHFLLSAFALLPQPVMNSSNGWFPFSSQTRILLTHSLEHKAIYGIHNLICFLLWLARP